MSLASRRRRRAAGRCVPCGAMSATYRCARCQARHNARNRGRSRHPPKQFPHRPRRWQHLTVGERNRLLLNRRKARLEARRLRLHPCPNCFEPCKDPFGHRTQDGCRKALDAAIERQARDVERERRAAWLDQTLSPMPEADA